VTTPTVVGSSLSVSRISARAITMRHASHAVADISDRMIADFFALIDIDNSGSIEAPHVAPHGRGIGRRRSNGCMQIDELVRWLHEGTSANAAVADSHMKSRAEKLYALPSGNRGHRHPGFRRHGRCSRQCLCCICREEIQR
jgi:hypothetical protein